MDGVRRFECIFPEWGRRVLRNVSWTWEEDHRGDWPDPSVIFQNIPGINEVNLVLGYRADNWRVSAYVENAFDNLSYDGNYSNDDPDPVYIYSEHVFGPSRPRTAGVRFGYDF